MKRRGLGALLLGPACAGCSLMKPGMKSELVEFRHAPWSQQASLYEVNLRQFTADGTLRAFEAHLPRLQAMGVGILWFMPIQPIGALQRKGRLGSYYSVRDYTAVNPEFGTLDDFRRVVDRAHALDLRVILDWVANHTAWDHPWVTRHPGWYQKDEQGRIHAYTYRATPASEPEYWTDVVGLDFRVPELWPAMTEAMRFWRRETDIDGFRCDVASLVPTAFWEQVRVELAQDGDLFMLAESDAPELHARAFDMTYDWDLQGELRRIARGEADAAALRAWWLRRQAKYPPDAYRMTFTANHDTNSWQGSDAEVYGSRQALQTLAVVAALLPGMPLVYGGQESYLDRRLQFFERDPIAWKDYPLARFYAGLLGLKKSHPALGNGQFGGRLAFGVTGNEAVLLFTRERAGRSVRATVNLTPRPQPAVLDSGQRDTLAPWEWRIDVT